MLTVRMLTNEDLDSADRIIRAAYRETRGRLEEMQNHLLLQPDGWFLAVAEEEPVGLVGATNYGTFAYVGLMSVLPERQRQGIGRILMKHVLEWIEQQGCAATLLDASEMGFPLYQALHFVVDDYVGQWRREKDEKVRPMDERVELLHMENVEELANFDALYFGGQRAALLRLLLAKQSSRVFATRDEFGHLSGYLYARERVLGPWVTRTDQNAEVLLTHALANTAFTEAPTVRAPYANKAVGPLLQQYGFREQRALRHMRSGSLPVERKRANIYGQVSFALG
jgi:GNAT superfamily N-acetyltransferase